MRKKARKTIHLPTVIRAVKALGTWGRGHAQQSGTGSVKNESSHVAEALGSGREKSRLYD